MTTPPVNGPSDIENLLTNWLQGSLNQSVEEAKRTVNTEFLDNCKNVFKNLNVPIRMCAHKKRNGTCSKYCDPVKNALTMPEGNKDVVKHFCSGAHLHAARRNLKELQDAREIQRLKDDAAKAQQKYKEDRQRQVEKARNNQTTTAPAMVVKTKDGRTIRDEVQQVFVDPADINTTAPKPFTFNSPTTIVPIPKPVATTRPIVNPGAHVFSLVDNSPKPVRRNYTVVEEDQRDDNVLIGLTEVPFPVSPFDLDNLTGNTPEGRQRQENLEKTKTAHEKEKADSKMRELNGRMATAKRLVAAANNSTKSDYDRGDLEIDFIAEFLDASDPTLAEIVKEFKPKKHP